MNGPGELAIKPAAYATTALLFALVAVVISCSRQPVATTTAADHQDQDKRVREKTPRVWAPIEPQTEAVPPRKQREIPAAVIPQVVLSDQHTALCKLQVGDSMPDMRLPDLEDQEQHLHGFFGENLTVVLFWNGDQGMARTELADLQFDVAQPYVDLGVQVVGVAVRESAASAKEHLATVKATFPNLIDVDGAAFEQVGSGKLPRTYLLDEQGHILWFDIEYSRSTRRELFKAIRLVIANRTSSGPPFELEHPAPPPDSEERTRQSAGRPPHSWLGIRP